MSIERRDEFEKWFSTEHCAEDETVDFCKNGLMREAWYVAWVKALAWQAARAGQKAEAWLISKGEEKEVMFDSEYDRNDRNHDEKRGWKYDPLFTHANSDEWIKCSDRMPDVRCLAFTPSDHEEVRYRIVPERILKALSEATHWMPLPEPPKQEEGQ